MLRAALWILHRSRIAALIRRVMTRRGRIVIELHGVPEVASSSLPAGLRPSLTAKDLDAILKWLVTNFRMLHVEEFLRAETAGVLVTFDDGYANHATRALPLLERHRVPAVFFVATCHVSNPGNYLPAARGQIASLQGRLPSKKTLSELFEGMSVEQLTACAASSLITIGSHTVSHPFLTRCGESQLFHELADSRRFLEERIGQEVDLLAYPTGDYNARVARVAKEVGYRAAFVEDSGNHGLGAFEIPRVGIYRADDSYLETKLSGLHRRPLPVGSIVPE